MRVGIAITMLMLVGYIMYDLGFLSPDTELKHEKIAVRFMDFANVTGKEKLADMASHWISNRLEEIPESQVVKYSDANTDPNIQIATAGSNQRRKFAQQTGAANLLEGQIFRESDSLVFDAKIIDLADGSIRQKFGPIKCAIVNPMAGINEITGEIRGWWASRDLKFISVPKYEAYKSYLAARDVWLDDMDLAEQHLRKAIASDPTFIDPYFLLLGHLQNEDRYAERDALLIEIAINFKDMNARQINLLEVASADVAGDLRRTYKKFLNELDIAPEDLFINTEAMVMATYFVNDPLKAIDYFQLIPVDSLNLDNCGYCTTRLRTAVFAYLELDSVGRASELIQYIDEDEYLNIYRKIQVYTASGDTTALRKLIEKALVNEINRSASLWTVVAWQYILSGNDEGLEMALEMAQSERINHSTYTKAEVSYLLGGYSGIEHTIDEWLRDFPTNRYILSYGARVTAQIGNEDKIAHIMYLLDTADEEDVYDYGYYTYYKGVIEAIQGNDVKALDWLELAYSRGHQFSHLYYHNDIDLMPLFDNPRFQKLIHPMSQ
ncbi:MAG: hypothetical protein DRI69_06830 [Bacteroidetes bacterium]|nr:MAG: hypothetical protein DRI69_06830 [Bacteroidota bacterium]